MSSGHEGDIHTVDFQNFVDVDFGEDDLFGNTERIVAASVESFVADAAEVADTGDGDGDEAVEELLLDV